MELLEHLLFITAKTAIVILEIIGLVVIIFFAAKAVVNLFRRKKNVRMELTKGIALSLEFLLAGEILHTIIVRDFTDLYLLGGIAVIRIVFTLMTHFESKGETKKNKGDE